MTAMTGPTAQDWAVFRLLQEEHKLRTHLEGSGSRRTAHKSCACGFQTQRAGGSERPVWDEADAHLSSLLPGGTVTEPCWCGRLAVHVEGTGAWYHADSQFMGHRAFEGQR